MSLFTKNSCPCVFHWTASILGSDVAVSTETVDWVPSSYRLFAKSRPGPFAKNLGAPDVDRMSQGLLDLSAPHWGTQHYRESRTLGQTDRIEWKRSPSRWTRIPELSSASEHLHRTATLDSLILPYFLFLLTPEPNALVLQNEFLYLSLGSLSVVKLGLKKEVGGGYVLERLTAPDSPLAGPLRIYLTDMFIPYRVESEQSSLLISARLDQVFDKNFQSFIYSDGQLILNPPH